jgi:hypothetical protein
MSTKRKLASKRVNTKAPRTRTTQAPTNTKERAPGSILYAYVKPENRRWLKHQVADGRYPSVSTFIDALISAARYRKPFKAKQKAA